MADSTLTILVVGGVAGGASAATRARRMDEHAEIILFERGAYVSFANCGLPYYLGGEIVDRNSLLVATPRFLAKRFRLDVRTGQEVLSIDRKRKTITVKNHANGHSYEQAYDKLILAPGASPLVQPLDGIDAPNVFTLRDIPDTYAIQTAMRHAPNKRAVVVGAGFIGLEMIEQLVRTGFETSLVELQPQVLPGLDPEMAWPLEDEIRKQGVHIHLGTGLRKVWTDDNGVAVGVELDDGTVLNTDLVVLGIGVRPNNQLARQAGLELGSSGAIRTNRHAQTNDADIYAVGDVAEYVFGPTGQTMPIPLAGPANRAGRLAGQHAVTGRAEPLADVQGTAIVRVFGQTAALTGLSISKARQLDIPAKSVTILANDHAGYYPGATVITLKLIFRPDDGRILGAQAIGETGVDKRIDVIATAMAINGNVRHLTGLDLAYAPPFGSAKDPVHMAGFAACNQLDGITDFVDADADVTGMQVVDVRTPDELRELPFEGAENPVNIPLDVLRGRLDELDRNLPTVVTCYSSLRAHVASCILKQSGFQQVQVIAGGTVVRDRAFRAHRNVTERADVDPV